jgi:hypothetical protein
MLSNTSSKAENGKKYTSVVKQRLKKKAPCLPINDKS